jgi:hypothetical protein
LKGTTGSISVAGMLRLLCSYGRTGVLEVDSKIIKGFIEIKDGAITEAQITQGAEKKSNARDAVIELLLVLEEGSFYFEEKAPKKTRDTGLCVEELIMESARLFYIRHKNMVELADFLPPGNEVLKITRFSKGRKVIINFTSDEWNMLIAFNGDNNVDGVLLDSKTDKELAQVMIYALVTAGFLRRSRFKIPEISKIARASMGNIGLAIVDSAFMKLRVDRQRMGMKDFMGLLSELENAFAEITGRTKAKEIIEKIWAATK